MRGAILIPLVAACAPADAGRKAGATASSRVPEGVWRAGAAIDPSGGALPAPDALRRAYDFANLPRGGEAVTIRHGSMCVAAQSCQPVTWQATTLGRLQGGVRLAEDFRLPPGTRAFFGTGPNPRLAITLIAPAGRPLLALVPLCDAPPGSECRNGYQPWTPARAR